MEPGSANQKTLDTFQDLDSQQSRESTPCPNCGLQLSKEIVICPNDGTVLRNILADAEDKLSDQYEFIAEIGSGGMGVIYKARHKVLRQNVAIKMLQTNRLDEVSVRRFQQEAKAVTALDHPSIVRLRDFGVTESGQPHMVLDYIDGETLSDLIGKSAGIPLTEALDIFIQAADALEHAHSRGVLHRDLKPSNIMLIEIVSAPRLVKIVDFGIAKFADHNYEHPAIDLTQTGEIFGSPLYMSPEQASGAKLDGRSDIYSLGCVMYETLTGTPPFVGGSAIEIIFSQMNDRPTTLKEASLGREFPEELEAIVAKTLEKNPSQRYGSMSELKNALIKIRESQNPSERGVKPNPREIDSKNQRSFPLLPALWAALVVLAILAGTSGYFLFSSVTKAKVPLAQSEKIATIAKPSIVAQLAAPIVDLHGVEVDDKMLEAFDQPTATKSVNLDKSKVEGPGLAHLIHLPLQKLSLSGSRITDRAIEEIKNMSTLEQLDLSKTLISDRNLNQLKTLSKLTDINFNDDAVGHSVSNLIEKKWKNLKVAHLDRTKIGGEDECTRLANGKSLAVLTLNDVPIRDVDVKRLSGSTALRELQLDGSTVTDLSLPVFATMKNLKKLSLKRCSLNKKAINELRSARPDLTLETSNTLDNQIEAKNPIISVGKDEDNAEPTVKSSNDSVKHTASGE